MIDRVIQQAISQVLMPVYESEFSDSSYGFRPSRSAHQAQQKASQYVEEGRTTVIDTDLKNFFDAVNHDRLMYRLSTRTGDKYNVPQFSDSKLRQKRLNLQNEKQEKI